MSPEASYYLPLPFVGNREKNSKTIHEIANTRKLSEASKRHMMNDEVHPRPRSITVRLPKKEYCQSAPSKRDVVESRVPRKLSLLEKIERFDIKDQISLIDLTRAHQSGHQGQLVQAPPPRSIPFMMDFLDEMARDYPEVYDSVQYFRSVEGRRRSAKRSTHINDRPSLRALTRRQSRLSLSIGAEEVEELENLNITKHSIIRTRSKSECDVSEAYLRWQSKQCDAVKGRALELLARMDFNQEAEFLDNNSLRISSLKQSDTESTLKKQNSTNNNSEGMDKMGKLDTNEEKFSINIVRKKYSYVRNDCLES